MKATATLPEELNIFDANPVRRVQHAIETLKAGKAVLLADDEDRENECDLLFPADTMTETDMALMIRHCSGIVCLCLTEEKADLLQLPPMVSVNNSRFGTPFTVSIEAAEGVSTGISAADRIRTVRAASAPAATPEDLLRPGHIFPLRAKNGGVLERNGHTEGSIDLMRIAGFSPGAVLCELMNDDGTVARLPQAISFAEKHGFAVLTIEDIIHYRSFVVPEI